MDDLITQVNRLNSELTQSIKLLRKNGESFAQAERDYQVAKAQMALLLKDTGCGSTEINLRIKGEVADKLFARDVAKVMYEANQEHINTVKLQLRLLDNQIAREWGGNG